MIDKEIEKKIEIFLFEKTYTFIKLKNLFLNGYIEKKENNYIMFKEDVLKIIPILISDIIEIDYSTKKRGDNEN